MVSAANQEDLVGGIGGRAGRGPPDHDVIQVHAVVEPQRVSDLVENHLAHRELGGLRVESAQFDSATDRIPVRRPFLHPVVVEDYVAAISHIHTERRGSVDKIEHLGAEDRVQAEQLAAGQPNLTVHDIFTEDLGDGWYVDIGWYEVTSPTPDGDATTVGTYLTIVETDAEGARKIRWSATNGRTTM